jgi:hypothetical protein
MATISWAVILSSTKLARRVKAEVVAEEDGPAAVEEVEAVAAMAVVVADGRAAEAVAEVAVAEEAGTVIAGIAVAVAIGAGKSLQDMKLRYKPGSITAPRFLFWRLFPLLSI